MFNQKSAATDQALCIKSDVNQNEFFILENRRKQGWDRYAPGSGIMITHVTYDVERWWYNTTNNENIQLMTLMNADNSWTYYDEGTDLWPQKEKTEFTDNSTPAAKLNMTANGSITGNAGYLGKPVTGMVINPDGTASFWYMKYYNPVMQPADSAFINLTQFRADWTDQSLDEDVASYTLEVNTKPDVELLGTVDGLDYAGSYAYIDLPAPWGGAGVVGGNNAIYIVSGGNVTFTVPQGYDNATFTLKLTTVSHAYGIGNISVATPQTAEVEHYFNSGETYYWLVTASTGEYITITSNDASYSPDIALIEVYSGDATKGRLRATETGDDTYRLITGITDKFYTVKNLVAGGTYIYKVKALYIDGTESAWSNKQEVTLFENTLPFVRGDVNGDSNVNMDDLATLINYLVYGTTIINFHGAATCSSTDSEIVNMDDLTALINYLVYNQWPSIKAG